MLDSPLPMLPQSHFMLKICEWVAALIPSRDLRWKRKGIEILGVQVGMAYLYYNGYWWTRFNSNVQVFGMTAELDVLYVHRQKK